MPYNPELDPNIQQFTAKEIAAENPETMNSNLSSDLRSKSTYKQSSYQEIHVLDGSEIERIGDKCHELKIANHISVATEEITENMHHLTEMDREICEVATKEVAAETHKISIGKIREMRGQVSGTFNEMGGMDCDLWLAKSMTNQMTLKHNSEADTDYKFQTIKEPSLNQRMQTLDNLDKETNSTVRQPVASDSCIPEMSLKDARTKTVSYSVKTETDFCAYNSISLLGPPGSHVKENVVNMYEELSTRKLKKEKELACGVCKEAISKHKSIHNGNVFYECCVCNYDTCKLVALQKHSGSHYPKQFCDICRNHHNEGNSHDGEHKCNVCKDIFQCRTQYRQNFSAIIGDHFNNKESLYVCCMCRYKTDLNDSLRIRNHRYIPKILCTICKEEYTKEEKGLHNSEFRCFVCEKKFQCKIQLEEHSEDPDEWCFKHCKLCKEKIEEHFLFEKRTRLFQCCRCLLECKDESDLQKHLLFHTDLRLFKCYVCGKRFQEFSFWMHSRSCSELPYKGKTWKVKVTRRKFL